MHKKAVVVVSTVIGVFGGLMIYAKNKKKEKRTS